MRTPVPAELERNPATWDCTGYLALLRECDVIFALWGLQLCLLPLTQEKTYNPYYTLVCQHLCRSSHSYKITLQFCLWDFFRDLGETSVGGAQVIKTLQDHEDEGFDSKKISKTRVRNVAKAYAWWIAKDCVNLTVLKVRTIQNALHLQLIFVNP